MNLRPGSLFLAVGGLALGFVVAFTQPAPEVHELNFNHQKHQLIACDICHRGVMTQARATLPSTSFCTRCHATSPDPSPEGQKIWSGAVSRWRWPVSFRLPRHVYFSHRRHAVLGQLSCSTCHAGMSAQTVPVTKPPKTWKMKDCLHCHETKNVVDDCAQCHR